jgi:hypothetical protein
LEALHRTRPGNHRHERGYTKSIRAVPMADLPSEPAFASAMHPGWELVDAPGVSSEVTGSGLVPRLLTVAFSFVVGCAHGANRESVLPADSDASWLDAPLLGEAVDPAVLQGLQGPPAARIVRLEHLIDLFDAARFGEDEYAREALWAALGGHSIGIGAAATREATGRLLQEALAIEAETDDALHDDHRRFLADAIMLLSVDLELPSTAEGLSIRTLAYRTLVERGHPRIVGNARWRLYDHVRGTLEGAAHAPPAERMEVAVQALYAERDEVDAWLAELVPHARPEWPTPTELWSSLQRHRDALAASPAWAPVVARRDAIDQDLRDTVLTVLPASRDAGWRLVSAKAGTGREEGLGPVLVATEGEAIVDAGRPGARAFGLDEASSPLVRSIGAAIAQDGRGLMLVVADPELPSPELAVVLEALRRAQVSRIELAIREPRLDGGGRPAAETGDEVDPGEVLVALPIEVAVPATERPRASTLAVLDARIAVHLTGRGPRFILDGRSLSTKVEDRHRLEELIRALTRAYPRERVVRLTLEDDVMVQQLVDLLAALRGGPDRPFAVVGWAPETDSSREQESMSERHLRTRADALWPKPGVDLDQAYPLHGDDQKRLEAFVAGLGACVPELEQAPPPALRLHLAFEGGRLVEVRGPDVRRLPETRAASFRACVEELALPFRLARHRDRVEVGVTLSPSNAG